MTITIGSAVRVESPRESRAHRILISGAPVLVFAFLTAVGASVRVPLPFTPVPLTLQTFFVLLAGGLLGAGRGFSSQLLYLGLGAAGVPVFAAGPLALLGPTGGYLTGFAASALLVGWLTAGGAGRSFFRTAGAMTLGLGVIYLLGVLQLLLLAPVSPGEAVAIGVAPFVPGDLAKLAAAAGIVAAARRRLSR